MTTIGKKPEPTTPSLPGEPPKPASLPVTPTPQSLKATGWVANGTAGRRATGNQTAFVPEQNPTAQTSGLESLRGRERPQPLDPNTGLMGPEGDARREELKAMTPEQRRAALSQLNDVERMLLLGGSSLRADVHTTGAAYAPDWNRLPPPAGERGYDAELSWAMAVAAKRVYEPLGAAGSTEITPAVEDLAKAGFKIDYLGDDKTSTQGFVATRGEQVIISFRGTEPGKLNDLLTDANILRVPVSGGFAHMGFNSALNEVWPQVEQSLARAKAALPPGKELSVNVTGHSLGAAIATLGAMKIQEGGHGNVDGVFTFGSPRVLDPFAARRYDQVLGDRTFRHENSSDLVAKIPAVAWKHVGQHIFFDHEGNQHTNPNWRFVIGEAHKSNSTAISEGRDAHRGREIEGLWRHGIDGYAKHKYVNQNVPVPAWDPRAERAP